MTAQPLNKEIYEKLTQAGVKQLILQFSGGNDEGYLNVDLQPRVDWKNDTLVTERRKLEGECEEWAWSVYGYSGAGDGTEFGDDIVYNLETKKVSSSEWFYERKDIQYNSENFEII